MLSRLLAAAAGAVVFGGCSLGGSPAATPRPTPTPSPTATVALRPPSQAVLATAGALPAVTVRDHLSAAEYAASAPDQVLGLAEVESWGWADAAQRVWSDGHSSVDDLVLETDRPESAQRAFAAWSAQASAAPFAAAACPASITGLDDCRIGTAGGRTLVVGRLDAEVFRLDAAGVDALPLAAAQAQRLRAEQ